MHGHLVGCEGPPGHGQGGEGGEFWRREEEEGGALPYNTIKHLQGRTKSQGIHFGVSFGSKIATKKIIVIHDYELWE